MKLTKRIAPGFMANICSVTQLTHGLTRIRGITQADVAPLMQRFKVGFECKIMMGVLALGGCCADVYYFLLFTSNF